MQCIFCSCSHSHMMIWWFIVPIFRSTCYPLLLGGQRWCGFKASPRLLHMTSTAGIEHRNPNLGPNALTARSCAPQLWGSNQYDLIIQITVISMLTDLVKELCFRPRFCTCKAILDRGHPGLMRWILLCIMPPVKDRSELLTSSPAHFHCTTDVTCPI